MLQVNREKEITAPTVVSFTNFNLHDKSWSLFIPLSQDHWAWLGLCCVWQAVLLLYFGVKVDFASAQRFLACSWHCVSSRERQNLRPNLPLLSVLTAGAWRGVWREKGSLPQGRGWAPLENAVLSKPKFPTNHFNKWKRPSVTLNPS